MHEVLNYAMGHIESLVDQAVYHQGLGNDIEAQLLFDEARDLAESIDNGEDLLTLKLLSDVL
jgi:hypothetical protein